MEKGEGVKLKKEDKKVGFSAKNIAMNGYIYYNVREPRKFAALKNTAADGHYIMYTRRPKTTICRKLF